MKVESSVTAIAAALASGSIAALSRSAAPALRVWRGDAWSPRLCQHQPGTSAPVHRRRSDRSSGPRGAPEVGPVPVLIGNAMAIQSQLRSNRMRCSEIGEAAPRPDRKAWRSNAPGNPSRAEYLCRMDNPAGEPHGSWPERPRFPVGHHASLIATAAPTSPQAWVRSGVGYPARPGDWMTLNRTTTPVTLAPKRGIYTLEKMLPALRLAAKQRRQMLKLLPDNGGAIATVTRIPEILCFRVCSRPVPPHPSQELRARGDQRRGPRGSRTRGAGRNRARRGPTQGRSHYSRG